jgi:hypothetical protein
MRETTLVHDLKNQLGIVLGYANVLLEELAPNDPCRDGLNRIRQAAVQTLSDLTASDAVLGELVRRAAAAVEDIARISDELSHDTAAPEQLRIDLAEVTKAAAAASTTLASIGDRLSG